MGIDVAGAGFAGIALEAAGAPGVFVPPTKFFPIKTDTMKLNKQTDWRRTMKGVVDTIGHVPGNMHVAGDIDVEFLEDVHPYFMMATRMNVVKSAGPTNWIYTGTPFHNALPLAAAKSTLSITIVRGGQIFCFVGCIVHGHEFLLEGGVLMTKYHILGRDDVYAELTVTPSMPTNVPSATIPFGQGSYNIQVPTATQIFDVDKFTFTVDEGGNAEFRLRNNTPAAGGPSALSPQFIRFGERKVDLKLERDFVDRTEYNNWQNQINRAITIVVQRLGGSVNNQLTLTIPQGVEKDYSGLGLSGQGNLLRYTMDYECEYNATAGYSYQEVVASQESIV
jgi:hypothetical protein